MMVNTAPPLALWLMQSCLPLQATSPSEPSPVAIPREVSRSWRLRAHVGFVSVPAGRCLNP